MAVSGLQLLVQQGPRAGQSFDLDKPLITLGREAGSDIALEDPQVSRHHARLTLQASGYVVEDLGSTNGTFINEQRLAGAQPIHPGDKLRLGDNVVLSVSGSLQVGETVVGHGEAPTLPPSFGAPPPPPPSFSAPPPPRQSFGVPSPVSVGAPPPPPPAAQKRSRVWLWACGCLVLLCIVCGGIGAYLYMNPGPVNAFLKMIGVNLTFQ
jgi:hypothetical protein